MGLFICKWQTKYIQYHFNFFFLDYCFHYSFFFPKCWELRVELESNVETRNTRQRAKSFKCRSKKQTRNGNERLYVWLHQSLLNSHRYSYQLRILSTQTTVQLLSFSNVGAHELKIIVMNSIVFNRSFCSQFINSYRNWEIMILNIEWNGMELEGKKKDPFVYYIRWHVFILCAMLILWLLTQWNHFQ